MPDLRNGQGSIRTRRIIADRTRTGCREMKISWQPVLVLSKRLPPVRLKIHFQLPFLEHHFNRTDGKYFIVPTKYIHHNYGPSIALTHTQSWPAYHYLIQNNRIADNVTSAYNSGHVGYVIWMDCTEWADVSGNLMEGNTVNEIHTTENSKLVTVHNGAYTADQKEYEKQVPKAIISSDKTVYYAGEEITFSGADSVAPGGAALTFRWDMGDGTFAVGETVKHTFTETGYYVS